MRGWHGEGAAGGCRTSELGRRRIWGRGWERGGVSPWRSTASRARRAAPGTPCRAGPGRTGRSAQGPAAPGGGIAGGGGLGGRGGGRVKVGGRRVLGGAPARLGTAQPSAPPHSRVRPQLRGGTSTPLSPLPWAAGGPQRAYREGGGGNACHHSLSSPPTPIILPQQLSEGGGEGKDLSCSAAQSSPPPPIQ